MFCFPFRFLLALASIVTGDYIYIYMIYYIRVYKQGAEADTRGRQEKQVYLEFVVEAVISSKTLSVSSSFYPLR